MSHKLTGLEKFLTRFSPYMLEGELENILTAYIFAKYGHGYKGQVRDDGTRYFDHPKAVATILVDELQLVDNWRIVVTALLHDILEDSYLLGEHRIMVNFGRPVAFWVKLLTKKDKNIYYERLMGCGIWQVLMVKLCDRLHNLRTLSGCSKEKQLRQVQETNKYFPALADKLISLLTRKNKWRGEYLKKQILETCSKF